MRCAATWPEVLVYQRVLGIASRALARFPTRCRPRRPAWAAGTRVWPAGPAAVALAPNRVANQQEKPCRYDNPRRCCYPCSPATEAVNPADQVQAFMLLTPALTSQAGRRP